MKSYPSIPHSSKSPRQKCHAFVKYDGSNLRMEYSRKRGWYKFGTRKMLFDSNHPTFGGAIALFQESFASDFEKVFKDKFFKGIDSIIVFAEFFGSKSFAGQHQEDDLKTLVPFDINLNKKGFLSPKEFLDYFGHLKVAELVYMGNLNQTLIDGVKNNNYEVVDFRSRYDIITEAPEGVICKGGRGHSLWMCKIKSLAYLRTLKDKKPVGWEKLIEEDFDVAN